MPGEKIFLSAVTGQFKDCRDALRSDLAAVGAEVVVQEDFTQHGGTLLKKLEEYIASSDRVIALVGSAYGWEPESFPPDAPARSYTQWEYYFARGARLDGTTVKAKPVFMYLAAPSYLEEHPVEQSADAAQRQQAFIDEIRTSGKDRNTFDSTDKLARLVLRDGFKLSSSREHLIQNLPFDTLGALFKGREDFIDEIRGELSVSPGAATKITAKQAIHGLGGIGKTRLAVEYAWRCLPDYTACLFVIADSQANLERNLAGLCSPLILDLPEQSAQEQKIQVDAVGRWLNQHSGWLLILDNVDTEAALEAVERLLPTLQGGHVLITSRRTDWGDSIGTLALNTLSEDDAVAFLIEKTSARRTPGENDTETARSLAHALDGLALALEQAGSFISKKRISFSEYLDRWQRQEIKLLDHPVKHYPRSLAVTWETSFGQLTPAARALLNLLCWFAPDPIPRDIFQAAFEADTLAPLMAEERGDNSDSSSPPDLEDLLEELESLSLLKWESDNSGFIVHRLVQEITRTQLQEGVRQLSLRAAIDFINNALPVDPPPDDIRSWHIWDPLGPHVRQLVGFADEAEISDPTSRLMNDLGMCFNAKGLFAAAEPLMRRTLAIDEAIYGSKHPDVAIGFNNLAQLLQATHREPEAEHLMRQALEIDEASYGTSHPRVATDLNNLAHLLEDTNRLEEAESKMRRALEIREAVYGNEHPDVAISLTGLAGLLKATKRLEEAEPFMWRALAIDEATYGVDHPDVARDLNNLAVLLQETNRQDKAESFMRRALEIDEKSYGSAHLHVARDLNILAQLLHATGRQDEAESLMRRALEIDEASYGAEHPDVAVGLNNLSQLLCTTNRLDEAAQLSRRVVEIFLLFYIRTGHQHPHLENATENYLRLLSAMGQNEQEQQAEIESLLEAVNSRTSP